MRLKHLSFLLLLLPACISLEDPQTTMIRHTVKITNLAGNSGGSGSIISANNSGSLILTNAHVCEVARKGGIVTTTEGDAAYVQSFKQSQDHDLCLIKVLKNFGHAAQIAPAPPAYYSEAISVGHPKLLPVVVSEGRFSDEKSIQVLIDMKDCTDTEKSDPVLGLFCAVFGKLPLLKNYEAVVVSVLVQPGSSGSAVYDSEGHIAAVIFAGSSDVSYGFAVPHRYIVHFLMDEVQTIEATMPDYSQNIKDVLEESRPHKSEYVAKLKETCDEHRSNPKVAAVCSEWFRR